jgi:hypothetical protein
MTSQTSQTSPASNINGILSFVAVAAVGFFLSRQASDWATADLATSEAYEAFYRDQIAVEWTMIGSAISLVLAAVVGVIMRKVRFRIRDLLWLTLVAAILFAWWLDRQHLKAQLPDDDWGTKARIPVVG